jgi:quercetin dioxygenase-like cupin family protein
VISGRLRLVLGGRDFELGAGEAAEFDTRTPHWMGAVGDGPAELLHLSGPDGQRIHMPELNPPDLDGAGG